MFEGVKWYDWAAFIFFAIIAILKIDVFLRMGKQCLVECSSWYSWISSMAFPTVLLLILIGFFAYSWSEPRDWKSMPLLKRWIIVLLCSVPVVALVYDPYGIQAFADHLIRLVVLTLIVASVFYVEFWGLVSFEIMSEKRLKKK